MPTIAFLNFTPSCLSLFADVCYVSAYFLQTILYNSNNLHLLENHSTTYLCEKTLLLFVAYLLLHALGFPAPQTTRPAISTFPFITTTQSCLLLTNSFLS